MNHCPCFPNLSWETFRASVALAALLLVFLSCYLTSFIFLPVFLSSPSHSLSLCNSLSQTRRDAGHVFWLSWKLGEERP